MLDQHFLGPPRTDSGGAIYYGFDGVDDGINSVSASFQNVDASRNSAGVTGGFVSVLLANGGEVVNTTVTLSETRISHCQAPEG